MINYLKNFFTVFEALGDIQGIEISIKDETE
jgi:hypothetical protein